jgi:hypothetical protein
MKQRAIVGGRVLRVAETVLGQERVLNRVSPALPARKNPDTSGLVPGLKGMLAL